jgi:hypothetical protein
MIVDRGERVWYSSETSNEYAKNSFYGRSVRDSHKGIGDTRTYNNELHANESADQQQIVAFTRHTEKKSDRVT